jgi:hypothetical protein
MSNSDENSSMSVEAQVEALEVEGKDLSRVIEKVRRFPEKVSRPCEIPISDVASISGKFVHTNEFVDTGSQSLQFYEKDAGSSFLSHSETVGILDERLKNVQNQIKLMQKRGTVSVSKPVDRTAVDDEDDMMEIREFVDDQGREVRSEIVDVAKGVDDLSGVLEEIKNAQTGSENSEMIAKIEEKMKMLGGGRGENAMMQQDVQGLDAETRFAYEMHTAPFNNVDMSAAAHEDLGFLDDLESKEEEEEQKAKIKSVSDEKGFGKGFKAGFLSSSSSTRKAAPKSESPAKKTVVFSDAVKATVVEKTASPVKPLEKPKPKPKPAFGDTVFERVYN